MVAVLLLILVGTLRSAALDTNLIENPSVETVNSNNSSLPMAWNKEKLGTNTTTFTYRTDGHSSNRSLYINMTKRTSGNAKWYSDNISVKPNTSYTFSDYSKSNTRTKIVANFKLSDGTSKSLTLASNMAAHSSWFKKTVTFTSPSKASTVTFYHLIARVGWLQTDDYSLIDNSTVPAPTVNLVAPINGTSVNGTVAVSANATNAVGVQFKVDGVALGAEDTTAPYGISWDTTTTPNGIHVVTATARNSDGQTVTSTSTVTVSNVAAPTVIITTPLNNASVSGSQTLTANATNAVGVQFKVDGTNLGSEKTSSPYQIGWDTSGYINGIHTITAVARNSNGQTATSSVSVNVTNATQSQSNLILNPSVETVNPTNASLPQNWASNAWGTNSATFTYPVTGNTGSKAVRVDMTSYADGDAKWYFDHIAAKASTEYTFTDAYRSNVTTYVVVEMRNAAGNFSYAEIGSLPASSAWGSSYLTFTTKSDTTSFTIYHLIRSVGWLETDTFTVREDAVSSTNPIANESLELANGNVPTNWTSSSWGTNTPVFTYENDGHTGTKSVKTTITSYTDGDAKWFYDPITSLTKGKQYRWTTWYKTNTHPQAVAMFVRADGSEFFFGMPQPFPAANSATTWQKYSETFMVPNDAVAVSNFLFINGKGWVQVDDQSLTSYQPTAWNRPLVSLTFDDGYEENVTNALPVLDQYGFKTTQCFETTDLIANPIAGKANVMAFYNDNHEICSHTITHPFLTQLTTAQVDKELADSQTYLQNLIGAPVVDFASPYGDYNESVNTEIKKYYQSHRTVDEGFNSKDNLDVYRLRVQNMTPTTTLAQFQAWLDQAKADNTWLILVYHRITNDAPEAFDTRVADFKQQMAALNNSGITVETMRDALVEVKAQL